MRTFYSISILISISCIGLFSCASPSQKPSKVEDTNFSQVKKDTSEVNSVKVDSINLEPGYKPIEIDSNKVIEISNDTTIQDFLINPIDFQQFKEDNGPSNSGTANKTGLYKPNQAGMYLRFMLFQGNRARIKKLKLPDSFGMTELQFFVYRFGTEVGDFYDSNELLVGIKCRIRDPALGQANLVGKHITLIEKQFGKDFIQHDNCIIYQYQNRVLSLNIQGGNVSWFKYLYLAEPVTSNNIPKRLLKFRY